MKNYDEIKKELYESFSSKEGSLYFGDTKKRINEQERFLSEKLKEIHPNVVVEIGTEKAFFDLLCKRILPESEITTFGILKESSKAVDIINKYVDPKVKFIQGDSRETFSLYEGSPDFAWVDGGHFNHICLSDLKNCDRLKIPHICVDDYKGIKDVKEDVKTFLDEFPYTIEDVSGDDDTRGVVYLKRRDG